MSSLLRSFLLIAFMGTVLGSTLAACPTQPDHDADGTTADGGADRLPFLDEDGMLVPEEDAAFSAWLTSSTESSKTRACVSYRVRNEGWSFDEAVEDCNNPPH
ncbi:hypothetical protein HYS28_02690 [Candidatus Uhrbacteria bacterium]|nr:hypothetical protein [Candidatus Uhrbacteria bacterium]